jgi:hypothetical protein
MPAEGGYYYVWVVDKPDLALARASDDPELSKRMHSGNEINDWQILDLALDDGTVVDYLSNSYAFRLCSERLRAVLERQRADDFIQWLPAVVRHPGGEELAYWVLHLPRLPDVLNKTKSKFSGSNLIKPCLDPSLVAGHRIFAFSRYGAALVVAEQVRAAIAEAGCTGMTFSWVPMA